MPSGNGSSQKKAKPKAKAKPSSKSNGKSWLQKGEDAVGSAVKGAGDAIYKSQAARRDIFKGMGGKNGKGS